MLLTQCCDIPVPRITSTQLLIEPSNACKILARYLVIFAPSPLNASFDICLINLNGLLRMAVFRSFRDLDANVEIVRAIRSLPTVFRLPLSLQQF